MKRALIALLFAGAANAGTVDPLLAKEDVCGRFEIWHINGIMTNRQEATDNRNEITKVYGNGYREHVVFYGLAYNQTRSFASDFYDWAVQVIKEYAGATWNSFMNYVTFGTLSPYMPDATAKAISTTVLASFGITKISPYQDQDLADIMFDLGQSQKHARVILIPHSQGNLYANLVYDKLVAAGRIPARSLDVIGLAVAATSRRGSGTYFTSKNDVVVDAARKALSAVFPANRTIPVQSVDYLGHNMIDIYLKNTTVKTDLKAAITAKFAALRTTAPDPTVGTISATSYLYWCGNSGGTYVYPPDTRACFVDIPYGAPLDWYFNTWMTKWADPTTATPQHVLGKLDLAPISRNHVDYCFTWLVNDRKTRIKSIGARVDPGYGGYYPSSSHGSCPTGYPFGTPYGNADRAWTVFSADGSARYVASGESDGSTHSLARYGTCLR